MSATQRAVAPTREPEIIAGLKNIVSEMAGIRAEDIDVDATFIEMGAESLFLMQASSAITEKFGVRIPFRSLMEEYPTLRTLAAHIDQKMPVAAPVEVVQPPPAPEPPQPVVQQVAVAQAPPTPIVSNGSIEQIMAQQLQIMAQQLEVMRARQSRATTAPVQPATPPPAKTEEQPYVPYRKISKPGTSSLTEQQQQHLNDLIERVNRKTEKSKSLTQEYRPYFADSREVAGFRSLWKEMQYLIIVDQAIGSKIWDVDGNEYLDITMGFGSLLFGHSPDFVVDALQKSVAHGMQLGPQSHLAGQVAKLLCELTGTERATFCNSGTEAVMTALRLARTVSGRTKIAMFTGSYHGSFDGTLARAERGADGKLRAVPLAPGVPPSMIEDVMILTYGAPESLEEIRQHAGELAAVLVEPLQSRRPDNRPSEFLQEVRRVTEQSGTVLIFDEVVSGFRLHPGGAQVLFNIQADLVTYGKAAGAGMPIGIIAGKKKFMDPIDGGMWQYGDASYPRSETTFFVGTFFKHPMVMAAAWAALNHIKNCGPQLQERLNAKTQYLAETLNRYFKQEQAPISITHCGSLFRFANRNEFTFMDLFFYHLLEKGIYVWEGRNCFISTAHTDEDVEFLISKVKETVSELRAGGFLGDRPAMELTPIQHWFFEQKLAEPNHFNMSAMVKMGAGVQVETLRQSWAAVLRHHDALRQWPGSDLEVVDLSDVSTADLRHAIENVAAHSQRTLNLERGPMLRAVYMELGGERGARLLLVLHHLLVDITSWRIIFEDLETAYKQLANNEPVQLRATSSYQQWAAQLKAYASSEALRQELPYWTDERRLQVKPLPVDERGANLESTTHHVASKLSKELTESLLRDVPRAYNMQISDVLLAALAGAYQHWSGERLLLVDVEGHGREALFADVDLTRTVGWFTSIYPLLLELPVGNDLKSFREQIRRVRNGGIGYSVLRYLSNALPAQPRAEISFNYLGRHGGHEPTTSEVRDAGLFQTASEQTGPTRSENNERRYKLQLNSSVVGGELQVSWEYSTAIHREETVTQLAAEYLRELERLIRAATNKQKRLTPITSAQRELWILAQMGDDSSRAYNESMTLDLRGPLNTQALKQGIQELVNRHEALRTTFTPDGEHQQISDAETVNIPLIDLSEAQLAQWLDREVRKTFTLDQWPLVRFSLLKLAPEHHQLVITYHHIIADGWSMGIMLRELSTLYAAMCQGVSCTLPQPTQSSEYAEWQAEQQQEPEMDAAEAYWLGQFAGSIPFLELPFDRPRPAGWSFAGARAHAQLSLSLLNDLKKLATQQRSTLFTVLIASFSALLHRISGQDDLVIGVPTAGQTLMASESLVGYCVNLLPVRNRLEGNPSFVDYLAVVRRNLADAFDHQRYPYDKLTRKLGLSRDPGHPPLVSVTFNLDHYRKGSLKFFGLEADLLANHNGSTKFDLSLNPIETGEGIQIDCDYSTDLFNRERIERLLSHYETMLAAIVRTPSLPVLQLPLLDAREQQQILVGWNHLDHEAHYQPELVHRLFAQQVEQRPEQVALEFGDERVSYRELNERSNRLGRYLRELGVGPEVIVGLCVERSVEMVVAVLGVLKAGGAYLPLDPAYPLERLSLMLEETAVPLLLTQERLRGRLPREIAATVITLDRDWAEQESEYDGENLAGEVSVENLAYVIYTSGSTGRPKGVCVTHYGVKNLAQMQRHEFGLSRADRVMQFASLSFDASVWEMFGTLSTGATLCLPDPKSAWVTEMERQAINVVLVPPSLLAATEPQTIGQLRSLIVGGEACSRKVALAWSDRAPQMVNAYGPTEATVAVSISRDMRKELEESDEREPSIGRVIENTDLYIVDEQMQPQPVGVIGELLIGGVGLARGYWQRPELTAEKFVPHPFSEQAGARLYRTGDMARYLADGRVEFLGRSDQQVKVRGYRIELGEIEAVLRSQSGVQDAVVIVREKRLVGYVVRAGEAISMSAWRSRLSEQLPEYMIPAVIVELLELPLTSNGKVDRKALPDPGGTRPELQARYEGPRNEVEAELCRIWAAVLGLERVGIYDNFFELGGDSILSIQIVARANQKGLRLMPRQVFEQRTVAALAKMVDTTAVIENEQGEVSGEQRLTPIQQWFFAQSLAEPHHFNQSVLVSVRRRLQPELLKAAVEMLLRQHDALRLRFSPNGEAHYAAVSSEAPLTVHDLSAMEEPRGEIERLAAEAQASLDLSAGPLLRVHYYDLGAERDGRLLLVVHHLAVDIVSWGMLLEDLQRGYEQSQLPAKTTSYQQWGEALQEYAHSEQLLAQTDYWTSAERDDIKPLPVDGSGAHLEAAAREVTVRLGREETQWLLTEVPKATRAQVHEVLLLALAASLSQWNGAERVLIDVESHGREETIGAVDLTRTVGWFTVIYPLVVRLGEGSWSEKLRRVKEQQRQAPQGGIGYGVLRYLSGVEQLSRQPQAEVSFNYTGRGEVERSAGEGALVGPATEDRGANSSPRNRRSHMLEVNAGVGGGELQVHWSYSEGVHRHETIEQVAGQMLRVVQELIQETRQSTNPHFSTADFSEFGWNQTDLDAITDAIKNANANI
jgi:amino acid adenylation domain-containing protein/non-ribosomal peptide synthase protein (TIGR01720 family)